ncbi:hypothetical protein AG1IA_06818 [Rhizoctonia solani AG-1 IA]|uniref:Uncharacterized protein n=1 Tax=Thanatephorus cucumeris (strain AG1-IA) TaxID=983506 RepID=L8WQU1_THACA|nr:hypothetical protein AG1IA_06818 [Rhizoctonia solani AG-1 IA]
MVSPKLVSVGHARYSTKTRDKGTERVQPTVPSRRYDAGNPSYIGLYSRQYPNVSKL